MPKERNTRGLEELSDLAPRFPRRELESDAWSLIKANLLCQASGIDFLLNQLSQHGKLAKLTRRD